MAPELCRGTSVGQDDIRGEVIGSADERRPDAVGIDRHAALLEDADLLGGEAAGGDDPHTAEAAGVERIPHLAYEPIVDARRLEVTHLFPQRLVDEGLGGVEPDAPEPIAERLSNLECRADGVVLEI